MKKAIEYFTNEKAEITTGYKIIIKYKKETGLENEELYLSTFNLIRLSKALLNVEDQIKEFHIISLD